MTDDAYLRLAQVLNELPNGFPSTATQVEIKLLKKIFTSEQADLFCDLRLTFETPEQLSSRTGRPLEGLQRKLMSMASAGQVMTTKIGSRRMFRMMPWIFGIYEYQRERMDKEFAELSGEYAQYYGKEFYSKKPQFAQILPVEVTIPFHQEALPYEKVSALIDNGQSFLIAECICKKEQSLLGKPCRKPSEVCLAISPDPGAFDKSQIGRVATREQVYDLMRKCEETGLVHLTSNVKSGHVWICNCCKCCCSVLRAIRELGIPASHVVNSCYFAEISMSECAGCGICAGERCQVGAIEENGNKYKVVEDNCIGCGLCIDTCPNDAIRLVRRAQSRIELPPDTEYEWYKERARIRGLDFRKYISDDSQND